MSPVSTLRSEPSFRFGVGIAPTGKLAAVGGRETCFRLAVEMQLKADDGGRNLIVLGELQLVLINRIDCQIVVVWLIALRRARTAVTIDAIIGTALDGAVGHAASPSRRRR